METTADARNSTTAMTNGRTWPLDGSVTATVGWTPSGIMAVVKGLLLGCNPDIPTAGTPARFDLNQNIRKRYVFIVPRLWCVKP